MLNVVALMGRLTADPELRYTQGSNIPVTTFTLAVDRSYVKQGTERQADFIDIVAWRSTAEFVSRYFRKGQLVAVQGSIQTRSYEDKQGIKRKAFEIVADSVHFAEPKRDNYMAPQAPRYDQTQSAPPQAPAAYSSGSVSEFEPVEDDLPF